MGAGHRGAAGMAAVRLLRLMGGAAGIADMNGGGGEPAVGLGMCAWRELRPVHAECAPFLVDQAARPELGDGEETRALEISRPARPAATPRRPPGLKRQAREKFP